MSNIDSATRSGFFPNTNNQSNRAGKSAKSAFQKNAPERQQEIESLTKRDAKVDIGDTIKDFAKIKRAVDAAPEVDNSEKIARLKSQIQAGTYKVDYDAIADKILAQEM